MTSPIDPNTPPHKTKPFWMVVALAALLAIGYLFVQPSHMPVAFEVATSVATFLMVVSIAWFAVRRMQRGQTGPSRFSIVLIILAIIFFILAQLFKNHP